MEWDMDRVLSKYEKDLVPPHISLLKTLLEVLTGSNEDRDLNKFEEWHKAVPIPYETWSDFDIVY
jgi:hypothetical protein